MRRVVPLLALTCLLALGGQSFAELCTIDAVPAATLLLPYFECGLTPTEDDPVASARSVDTFFSVNNASAAPAVVHVVLWGDWSQPSIDFNIFLTGYDVETLSLCDMFNNGNLPITSHAWNDPTDQISPHGRRLDDNEGTLWEQSGPHPGLSENPQWDSASEVVTPEGGIAGCGPEGVDCPRFPGCDTNLPLGVNPVLVGTFAERVRCGHTGRGLACDQVSCIGQVHDETGAGGNDFIARGYITIDNVTDCNLLFPGQAGYFGSGLTSEVNQLWGDWFIVQDGRAWGDNLVAIEASESGAFLPGDHTFYGRYVDGLATDQREPLASTWATRYFQPNALFPGGTDLLVWRDSKCRVSTSGFDNDCTPTSGTPPWWPLDETQVVAFDTQEDAYELCTDTPGVPGGGGISPPLPDQPGEGIQCFPLETGRYEVGAGDLAPPYDFGWMYLNLNFTLGDTSGSPTPCSTDGLFGDIAQSWVTTELESEGGIEGTLSVGFAATQLTSACSTANPIITGDLGDGE
ncbi:MAG: hypothetical protein GY719_29960 [bacterium]|nr:hypothetical protein [bacterium]